MTNKWAVRWGSAGPVRGWSIWSDDGSRIAHLGEGRQAERLANYLVTKHNECPTMSADSAKFLATRLRRLFVQFGYPLPDGAKDDDAYLIGIAGACIGGMLSKPAGEIVPNWNQRDERTEGVRAHLYWDLPVGTKLFAVKKEDL